MKNFVTNQLAVFQKSDFWQKENVFKAIRLFMAWAIISCVFVLIVEQIDQTAQIYPVGYLQKAIKQGIGPELWNVIGAFGFFFLGLTLLFPQFKIFSEIACHVLETTFGVGALMFGLLAGETISAFSSVSIVSWKTWFWEVSLTGLFAILFCINLLVWYFSYLSGKQSRRYGMLKKLKSVSFLLRCPLALLLIILPIGVLLLER